MQVLRFSVFDIFIRKNIEEKIKEASDELLHIEYDTSEKFNYNRATKSNEEIINDICGYIKFIQNQINEYHSSLT